MTGAGGARVLVTGDRGLIGRSVAACLSENGWTVVGFDLADGHDLLDRDAVGLAARGCEAVVHLGALVHDTAGTPEQIMAVNVLGTWHVLLAAEAAGASRVVHFSSGQVLGIAEGERLPVAFPVDDCHPRRAQRPYGLSKKLTEDLCEAFTARTGIASIALRPVAVWEPARYGEVAARRTADPSSEWSPFWEFGAFVDIRDVADAVLRALRTSLCGHHRALLCADEISGSAPSLELVRRLAPGIPVRDPGRYAAYPRAALFDCAVARRVLGWRPAYGAGGQG